MKLPRLQLFNRFDKKPKGQDEQVFAEASELALLRLEQCIADQRIPRSNRRPGPTSLAVTNQG